MKKLSKKDPKEKLLNELQLLTEMAGISMDISGLNYKLWIGYHGMSKHFHPYVKIMKGKEEFASVTIKEPIKVLVGKIDKIKKRDWEKIVEFIDINREVLLNFYYHATDDDFSDIRDFYQKLKKVS